MLSREEQQTAASTARTGVTRRIEPPTSEEFPASVPGSPEALLGEAEMVATSAVRRYPESLLALAILAQWQSMTGQDAASEKTWREILARNERFLDAYRELMNLAEKRQDYAEVVRLARAVIALVPQQEWAYLRLAQALSAQGEDELAVAVLQDRQAQQESPPAEQTRLLASILLRLQRVAEAEQILQSALKAYPDDPGLHRLMADLATAQQQPEKAEEHLRLASLASADAVEPNAAGDPLKELLYNLAALETKAAKMYYVQRDFIRTEIYLRRAITLAPDFIEARRALVSFYQEQGRFSQMEQALRDWLRVEPGNLRLYVTLAAYYGARQDFDRTENTLQQAAEKIPESPVPLAMLARLYLDARQKIELAVPLAEKVVGMQPIAINYQLLAEALEAVGRTDEALAAIEKALAEDPNQPTFEGIRKRLVEKIGQKKQNTQPAPPG